MHGPASGSSAEPNITPLIDVLLVLLIIFMIGVTIRQRVITVQLSAERISSGYTGSIVLEVLPGGEYAINRSRVPARELGSRLRAIYEARPEKLIFVRGDPGVRYQDVITAMDSARGAGVQVISIPPKGSRGGG